MEAEADNKKKNKGPLCQGKGGVVDNNVNCQSWPG
jgi:hypothetical protein